ncbi:MAG: winged helix-turn-helix transcriptional regulator [Thermoplasmatota archaeon]
MRLALVVALFLASPVAALPLASLDLPSLAPPPALPALPVVGLPDLPLNLSLSPALTAPADPNAPPEAPPTPAPLAIAAAVTAVTLAPFAWGPVAWQAARRWALRVAGAAGFGALFSRISGDQLLDNPHRARVYEAVCTDPGLSIVSLRGRCGISWTTAVHHLRRLEQGGLVVSVREGGFRRYFAGRSEEARQCRPIAALARPGTRRVADVVAQSPGLNQKELCRLLGIANPAASKQLARLNRLGLVEVQREGRQRRYWPTPHLGEMQQLLSRPHTAAAPAAPWVAASPEIAAETA